MLYFFGKNLEKCKGASPCFFFEFLAKIWKFIKGLIHAIFFLAKIWKNVKVLVHAFFNFCQNLKKGLIHAFFEFLVQI